MAFPTAFKDWRYRAPLTYVKNYVGSGDSFPMGSANTTGR